MCARNGSSVTAGPSEKAFTLESFAESFASAVGGRAEVSYGTAKVKVGVAGWKDAIRTARDDFGLVFLSWLSAIDWQNEVAVGDRPNEPVEERYELLCALSDVTDGKLLAISTVLDHAKPSIESVSDVFPGANWHERETAEMFGIDFIGHPDLINLYLPDDFEGHPLRKSFPLLSREVKPWPGKVDVEEMPENGAEPATENPGI